MLSEKERSIITSILDLLDDFELSGLCKTVTSGVLSPETRSEAYQAIVLHSDSLSQFLNRKKITVAMLLKFIKNHNLQCRVNSGKSHIVLFLLDFVKDSESLGTHELEPTIKMVTMAADTTTDTQAISTVDTNKYPIEATVSTLSSNTSSDFNLFSTQFCDWFYTMWNSGEPILVDHFYPDCNFKVKCLYPYVQNEIDFYISSGRGVCEFLSQWSYDRRVFFNHHSKTVTLSPHGPAQVFVAGTIHTYDNSIGVFEHMFGLVQDNQTCSNWKIKCMEWKMKSQLTLFADDLKQLCDMNP